MGVIWPITRPGSTRTRYVFFSKIVVVFADRYLIFGYARKLEYAEKWIGRQFDATWAKHWIRLKPEGSIFGKFQGCCLIFEFSCNFLNFSGSRKGGTRHKCQWVCPPKILTYAKQITDCTFTISRNTIRDVYIIENLLYGLYLISMFISKYHMSLTVRKCIVVLKISNISFRYDMTY